MAILKGGHLLETRIGNRECNRVRSIFWEAVRLVENRLVCGASPEFQAKGILSSRWCNRRWFGLEFPCLSGSGNQVARPSVRLVVTLAVEENLCFHV